LAEAGYATPEQARQYLKDCEDTLAAFSQHDEVIIWLDHRLSDQLILIKVLEWFSCRNLAGVKLSLVCVGRYPGLDQFVGLGELTANQLTSLADTRFRVGEAQYRTAQAAWNAFTSPDPTEIERFIQTDTSALPFPEHGSSSRYSGWRSGSSMADNSFGVPIPTPCGFVAPQIDTAKPSINAI
jgi:hypothetical protein